MSEAMTVVQEERVVLIVDDDESIRETLALALELEQHPSALAANGVEALAWLRSHRPPCLILMDLMMPVMDGWQMFEQLRKEERFARLPVVVITAFETAFGRDLGTLADLPILRKPIELETLLRTVRLHRHTEPTSSAPPC